MKITRALSGLVAFLALTFLLAGHSALIADAPADPATHPQDGLSKYLPKIVEDQFNPDVKDSDRATPHPRRGGKLRIRTPATFQHFNRLTVTGQPEILVLNQMSDFLANQNLETLEYYPELAWSWKETDMIKRKDGPAVEGRIVEQTADSITFVPGAWKITYAICDTAKIDEANNFVVLKDDLGSTKVQGRLTMLEYTVKVDEGFDSDIASKKEKIPVSDLDTWDNVVGSKTEKRTYAKLNTAFQFFIRKGVTWQDGKPFTGEDVKFSYETILNPTVDAQPIRSAFEDVTLCDLSPDKMTVHIQYRKPYFKAIEAIGSNYLVPKHVFNPEQYGGDEKAFGEAFNAHPFREQPVYTGAYRIKSWKRGDTLTIERNPTYWKNNLPEDRLIRWKKDQPYLDEISWVLYRDPGTSVKDLQNGVIDADLDVEPSTWVQPDTNNDQFKEKMIRAENFGLLYTYIGWNLKNPIFKDVNVRRAMAMMIPRDEIIKNVYQGVAFPTDGPFYRYGPEYDESVKPIPYDPDGAKKLLTKAGWLDRDGDGILEKEIDGKVVPFKFRYSIHNGRDYHQKVADIIKEHVEQAKIEMTIIKSDWSIYADTIRDKNFDAARFASSTELDADPFIVWHSSQIENKGDNVVSYSDPRVDELCEKLRETPDMQKRWEMAKEIHRIIYEDQPACFLEIFKETYFISRKLRGIKLYTSVFPQNFCEWWWSDIPENRR